MTIVKKLGTTDSTSMVLHAEKDGKIRVASYLWGDDTKVVLPDQVLEVRWVAGTCRITIKERTRDEQDLPKSNDADPAYDPYGLELDPVAGYE